MCSFTILIKPKPIFATCMHNFSNFVLFLGHNINNRSITIHVCSNMQPCNNKIVWVGGVGGGGVNAHSFSVHCKIVDQALTDFLI